MAIGAFSLASVELRENRRSNTSDIARMPEKAKKKAADATRRHRPPLNQPSVDLELVRIFIDATRANHGYVKFLIFGPPQ